MKGSLEQTFADRRESEQAVSYLLRDESSFSQTRMKAIESGQDPCIIQCVRVLYNGRTKLVYLTGAYRRLDQCLPDMDADRFRTLAAELIREVGNIRYNSILSCECVDLAAERIFLDWGSGRIRLVCLPVKDSQPLPEAEFESILRQLLLAWLGRLAPEQQQELAPLAAKLGDGRTPLAALADSLGRDESRDRNAEPEPLTWSASKAAAGETLVLDSVGIVPPITFSVDHVPFIIGRKEGAVDGLVPGEYMRVGRRHCRIERTGDRYQVVDENSTNGTWVNDERLRPLVPETLSQGDVLRVANLSFTVKLTGGYGR